MSNEGVKKTATENLNISKYRIKQNYQDLCDVQQELVSVAMKRPPKSQFVWVHPDQSLHMEVAVYEDKINQEVYIVSQNVMNVLEGEWKAKVLIPYVIRGGGPALWPINLPDESGKLNSWPASAMQIAIDHAGSWFRLKSNPINSRYDILKPINQMDDPDWPWDVDELYEKAFKERIIESIDHPIVKELRGA